MHNGYTENKCKKIGFELPVSWIFSVVLFMILLVLEGYIILARQIEKQKKEEKEETSVEYKYCGSSFRSYVCILFVSEWGPIHLITVIGCAKVTKWACRIMNFPPVTYDKNIQVNSRSEWNWQGLCHHSLLYLKSKLQQERI